MIRTPIPRMGGRCGNYDADWRQQIKLLGPGDMRMLFTHGLGDFDTAPGPGWIRHELVYRYDARPARIDQWTEEQLPASEAHGEMQGIAPFELRSNAVPVRILKPTFSASEIEQDLTLALSVAGSGPWSSLEPIPLQGELHNRSDTRTHRLVIPKLRSFSFGMPGHTVRFQRNRETNGDWKQQLYSDGSLPDRRWDWREDVIELGPGESQTLPLPLVQQGVRLQGSNRVTAILHYDYRGYPVRPAGQYPARAFHPSDYGRMANVPPFGLEPQTITLEIVEPLSVRVTQAAVPDGLAETRLEDLLKIEIQNLSNDAFVLSSTDDPCLIRRLSVHGRGDLMEAPLAIVPTSLAPGESVEIVGAGLLRGLEALPAIPMQSVMDVSGKISFKRQAWGESLRADW